MPLANLNEVPPGCSLSLVTALFWIAREECTMTNLSNRLHVSRAAATGTMDRLEKTGLALRVRDGRDRRRVTVQPTAQGLELARRVFGDPPKLLARH